MGKFYNTINYTGFYSHIFRRINQIFKNTLFYVYKISNKNYKLAILTTLAVLALIRVITILLRFSNRILLQFET